MTNFVYFQLMIPANDFFLFLSAFIYDMEPMFWVYNMHVEDLKEASVLQEIWLKSKTYMLRT